MRDTPGQLIRAVTVAPGAEAPEFTGVSGNSGRLRGDARPKITYLVGSSPADFVAPTARQHRDPAQYARVCGTTWI